MGASALRQPSSSFITIGHVNINGLSTHFQELELHCSKCNYDLFAVTESKLKSIIHSSSTFALDGYTIYRHDRAGIMGGGICLYARKGFSVSLLHSSDPLAHDIPEHAIYKVSSPSFTILLAIVYRRPEIHLPLAFLDSLSQLIPQFSHVIITGDFNINMAIETNNSTTFRRHFSDLALHLVKSDPTHHVFWKSDGSTHHTWIDLFLLNDPDRLVQYRKSDAPFTVGHDLIEIDYFVANSPPPPQMITCRNLHHITPNTIEPHLIQALTKLLPPPPKAVAPPLCHNFADHSLSSLTDSLTAAITAAINSTFDDLAPLRTFMTSPKHKPWVTSHIQQEIKQRNNLYKRASRFPCPVTIEAYRIKRNRVSNLISTAKNNFIADRITRAPTPAAKWRELHKLGLGRQSSTSPLSLFSAEALNQHFASVCNAAPPLSPAGIDAAVDEPTLPSISSFDFSPVDEETIARLLASANSNSTGLDNISAEMLHLSTPTILPHLTNLVNSSLRTGIFPKEWLRALVIPLPKTSPLKSLNDTRPIALLNELSKLLERVVHEQLSAHLSNNQLLDPRQSGYRPHHSAQTALLGILEDARLAIDRRKLTILVSYDFSKAFDTIPHQRLLAKLRRVGCSEHVIRWFGSYLTDRKQAIRMGNGDTTPWLSLSTGVPQGSVLGPLLFTIYLLDLPSYLLHSKHMIYADDTQIYHHCKPTPEGLAGLSHALSCDSSAISHWAAENGLKLNSGKTVAIIIGSAAYISKLDLSSIPKVRVLNTDIPYQDRISSLGVSISSSLNWDRHITDISSRVYAALHSLRFYKHALSRSLRKELVQTLIFPHFDYACAVYHDMSGEQNVRLHRLLNACVRYVYGTIPWDAHVTPYRLALGWLSVKRRRELFIGLQGFKIAKFNAPSYLADHLIPYHDCPDLRLSSRIPHGYYLPRKARTTTLEKSFSFEAARIVNLFHQLDIRLTSITTFKSLLRDLLYRTDLQDWALRAHIQHLTPIPRSLTGILQLPPPLPLPAHL